MEPNSREFYKQCAFQKFCNTVLHNEACDAHRELHRHKAREVTFSDFYRLIRESTSAELMKNAVNCNVPHRYIREMVTGVPEETSIKPDGEGGKEHVDTDTE